MGAQAALGIPGLPWTTHLLPRPQPAARMAGPTFITSFLSEALPVGPASDTPYRSVANATIAVAGPGGLFPPVGGLLGDFQDHVVRPRCSTCEGQECLQVATLVSGRMELGTACHSARSRLAACATATRPKRWPGSVVYCSGISAAKPPTLLSCQ